MRTTAAGLVQPETDVVTTVVHDVGHHGGIGQLVALVSDLRLLLQRWHGRPR
jgi:hypothetical protein